MFKKYIKMKDPAEKIEIHDKYKYCRNLLSTVIKKSKKKKNYNEFFKNKMNNMKNTWKGIRNLIFWKQSASSSNIHLSYLSMKQFQTLRKLPTFLLITSAQ